MVHTCIHIQNAGAGERYINLLVLSTSKHTGKMFLPIFGGATLKNYWYHRRGFSKGRARSWPRGGTATVLRGSTISYLPPSTKISTREIRVRTMSLISKVSHQQLKTSQIQKKNQTWNRKNSARTGKSSQPKRPVRCADTCCRFVCANPAIAYKLVCVLSPVFGTLMGKSSDGGNQRSYRNSSMRLSPLSWWKEDLLESHNHQEAHPLSWAG